MTYDIVELVICSGFTFLVGYVIAKARPKNALREALYRARPELKPNMVFTLDNKLEIMFWPYESDLGKVTATILTEENCKHLESLYGLKDLRLGDYFVLDKNKPVVMLPEVFEYRYQRVNTP